MNGRTTLILGLLLVSLVLAGCEAPPPHIVQNGYRGLSMQQNYNPRRLQETINANVVPETIADAAPGGPLAKDVYNNVQVLGDLTVNEFNRTMVALTTWVAPKEGCTYCHEGVNWESDGVYTKLASRRMLEMTRATNAEWTDHIADTGVTCYTCHRGNPVPPITWTTDPGPKTASGFRSTGQNAVAPDAAYTSLPFDPFTPFLGADPAEIQVVGHTPLPEGNRQSIKQTEWTYALMMHMSKSLGVNCTFCHNSRSFMSWDQSTPKRTTAWYAIRHVRDMNNSYVTPLTDILPDSRKGPLGDVFKINCATCHHGVYKPLFGAPMAKDYPALMGQSASAEDQDDAAATEDESVLAEDDGLGGDEVVAEEAAGDEEVAQADMESVPAPIRYQPLSEDSADDEIIDAL